MSISMDISTFGTQSDSISNTNGVTAKEICNNYGLIYNTSGGGNQIGGNKIKEFTKKLVSNRVLDLYLKYMGITTLTTSTLVPMALIMGRDAFSNAIKYILNSDQKGGHFLKGKIPVLDDPLIGNYLKIAGLTALNVSPYTLVPLGILMTLYDMYSNDEQQGGRVTMPAKYFNPGDAETYVSSDSLPSDTQYSSPPYSPKLSTEQHGSGRLITGQSIPPNIVQEGDRLIRGQDVTSPFRSLIYYNDDMQLGNSGDVFNSSENALKPLEMNVKGFADQGISDYIVTETIGPNTPRSSISTHSDPISGYDTHPPASPADFESIVPAAMAGGGDDSLSGGGSDWASSQLSRGAVNSPGQNEKQFRMFTTTSDYIANKELSMGAADHWSDTSSVTHETLYEQTPNLGNEPNGYNVFGVSSSTYGGN